jgi:hypothetical protein
MLKKLILLISLIIVISSNELRGQTPGDILKEYIEAFKKKNYQTISLYDARYQIDIYNLKRKGLPDPIFDKKKAEMEKRFFNKLDKTYKYAEFLILSEVPEKELRKSMPDKLGPILARDFLPHAYLVVPNSSYKISKVTKKLSTLGNYEYYKVYVEMEYPDKKQAPFIPQKVGLRGHGRKVKSIFIEFDVQNKIGDGWGGVISLDRMIIECIGILDEGTTTY